MTSSTQWVNLTERIFMYGHLPFHSFSLAYPYKKIQNSPLSYLENRAKGILFCLSEYDLPDSTTILYLKMNELWFYTSENICTFPNTVFIGVQAQC